MDVVIVLARSLQIIPQNNEALAVAKWSSPPLALEFQYYHLYPQLRSCSTTGGRTIAVLLLNAKAERFWPQL